jgi:hypothetical protein
MKKPTLSRDALLRYDTKASVAEPVSPTFSPTPTSVQTNRIGKKAIIGYFSNDCAWQWKQLALEQRKNQQELLAEAVNDCFAKYEKARLA